uniref:Shugoshin C-terminal domain-containing protein n=1 Tax=Setaria digitata TaxID=48799 RepID=A0A915PIV9_9BILA
MCSTNAAPKFSLQNCQEQPKGKKKPQNNFEADSTSSVPNGSANSIDHTEYCNVHPSTSAEMYDRRQILRNIYSAKRSAPATFTRYHLAVKPSSFTPLPLKLLEKRPIHTLPHYNHGRTPEREEIDNLREELYGIKRNYAAVLKENVVLKTRLKRSSNEILRKDRQLQNLLFIQSQVYTSDEQRENMAAMKQKIIVLESLLKEKNNEISRLKYDREALKISNYRKHVAAPQTECKHTKRYPNRVTPQSKMQADLRGSSGRQRTVSESNRARKLKETINYLEKQNDRMRSKLQTFFKCSNCTTSDLSTFEREELIALIIHLKSELKKNEERKNNHNLRSGRSMQKDALPLREEKLVSVKHEFGKSMNKLKTKNKTKATKINTQKELTVEILRVHSNDEEQKRVMNAVEKNMSPKIATSTEEGGPNSNDWESGDSCIRINIFYTDLPFIDSLQHTYLTDRSSIPHEVADDAEGKKITGELVCSFDGIRSKSREVEDENKVAELTEQRQEMQIRNEFASRTVQKNIVKSGNPTHEYAVIDSAEVRSSAGNNQEVCKEITNSECACSENLKWSEDLPLKKKEAGENDVRFQNAKRELKNRKVMPNFCRSILRTTAAHLKRSKVLIAKTS